MQPGLTASIEYMWPDEIKRVASLEPIDDAGSGPFPSTYDPLWIVREVISGNEARFEWLNYITLNGALWKAKTHASTVGGTVNIRFEHEPYPEGDGHDDYIINFLDWERQPWTAVIRPMSSFPAQPMFEISRVG